MEIIIVIGAILLISAAYAAFRGAPWVPTHKPDLERIKNLLDLKEGENFVELGCGTGRVCHYIDRETKARSNGVELSLLQYLFARASGPAKIHLQDAFSHPMSEYDGVYVFLMPETYEKIKPKFEKELKRGARVVSYVWPIGGWEPKTIDEREGYPKLYLYEVK